ncbi:MAG: DUF1961 family protein [Cyclobacteriaceae bacterium]
MKFLKTIFIISIGILLAQCDGNTEQANLVFEDSCTGDPWEGWFLDGLKAQVSTSEEGMLFEAGPDHGSDSSHAVLWTKKTFEGDIRIAFDYTRTDTTTRCVNILYFHASGKGDSEFRTDIYEWRDQRRVPSMRKYFLNMSAYHISFAAFDANKYSGDNDYIRLRQYDPSLNKLGGTEILPDAFKTGLFKPFVTYHMEVLLSQGTINMSVVNQADANDKLEMKWDVSEKDPLKSGRIGLRHMYTRKAIYKNFTVWQLAE